MKTTDFTSHQPKMSPYCSNMALLVNEARDCVNGNVVDVRQVPINKILFTHPVEEAHTDRDISKHDNLPFAVLMDGYYHLLDGHGHVMDAVNDGFGKTLLFVADGDDEELTESKKKKKHHKAADYTPVMPFYGRWWYSGAHEPSHDHDNDHDGDDDLGTGNLDLTNGDTSSDSSGDQS